MPISKRRKSRNAETRRRTTPSYPVVEFLADQGVDCELVRNWEAGIETMLDAAWQETVEEAARDGVQLERERRR